MNDKSEPYSKTTIPNLKQNVKTYFGNQKGLVIYNEACKIFLSYLKTAEYRNNTAIEWHLKSNLLPALSYYKALLAQGIDELEAIKFLSDELELSAQNKSKEFNKLLKIPFLFLVFRFVVKVEMAKSFPTAGWETKWKKDNKHEVAFDLTRCLYCDVLKEYDAFELCPVFCNTDITSFNGLQPKIAFQRTQTLAQNGKCCDFRYINNKQ